MRFVVSLSAALVLVGCASKRPEPPTQLLTPGARLIYHGGGPAGFGVWSVCDRGARVYLTEAGSVFVVPNGCPSGEP